MASEIEGNEEFFSFGLAMVGLREAIRRLDASDALFPSTVVETAWWISAAAKSCGHNKDGDVLHGFWWVRSKGSHRTTYAFLAVMWPESPDYKLGRARQWQPIPPKFLVPEDSPAAYKEHLEGRDIRVTIDEAYQQLKSYMEELNISVSGM